MPRHRLHGKHAGKGKYRRGAASSLNNRLHFEGAPVAEVNVGQRLHELRVGQGLSIRSLAEMSCLAVNTLSLLENGKTSPSVSTLQQLAIALEVPITAFFEPETVKQRVVFTHSQQRPHATFEGSLFEDLGAGFKNKVVQPLVITLEPNAGSGSTPIVHTGHEFIYCLQGKVKYAIEDQSYLLEPGDSLLFESHLPHRWENIDAGASRIILVLFPSDIRDRSAERHFGID